VTCLVADVLHLVFNAVLTLVLVLPREAVVAGLVHVTRIAGVAVLALTLVGANILIAANTRDVVVVGQFIALHRFLAYTTETILGAHGAL